MTYKTVEFQKKDSLFVWIIPRDRYEPYVLVGIGQVFLYAIELPVCGHKKTLQGSIIIITLYF